MRSIKRGRGPSMMGGISSIFMALFGLLWTIIAGSIGGPFFCIVWSDFYWAGSRGGSL